MTEVTKPAGHPARLVNHLDRSQRRLDGRHFVRPDSAPKVVRAQVYAGRSGDYCVSVWFPSNAEAAMAEIMAALGGPHYPVRPDGASR
jgi:hypothetical protein